MLRNPETEPSENLRPGTACSKEERYNEVALEFRAGTGGSREGSLEEVLQQLDLTRRAALGCGEWEAQMAKKHFTQISLGMGAGGRSYS